MTNNTPRSGRLTPFEIQTRPGLGVQSSRRHAADTPEKRFPVGVNGERRSRSQSAVVGTPTNRPSPGPRRRSTASCASSGQRNLQRPTPLNKAISPRLQTPPDIPEELAKHNNVNPVNHRSIPSQGHQNPTPKTAALRKVGSAEANSRSPKKHLHHVSLSPQRRHPRRTNAQKQLPTEQKKDQWNRAIPNQDVPKRRPPRLDMVAAHSPVGRNKAIPIVGSPRHDTSRPRGAGNRLPDDGLCSTSNTEAAATLSQEDCMLLMGVQPGSDIAAWLINIQLQLKMRAAGGEARNDSYQNRPPPLLPKRRGEPHHDVHNRHPQPSLQQEWIDEQSRSVTAVQVQHIPEDHASCPPSYRAIDCDRTFQPQPVVEPVARWSPIMPQAVSVHMLSSDDDMRKSDCVSPITLMHTRKVPSPLQPTHASRAFPRGSIQSLTAPPTALPKPPMSREGQGGHPAAPTQRYAVSDTSSTDSNTDCDVATDTLDRPENPTGDKWGSRRSNGPGMAMAMRYSSRLPSLTAPHSHVLRHSVSCKDDVKCSTMRHPERLPTDLPAHAAERDRCSLVKVQASTSRLTAEGAKQNNHIPSFTSPPASDPNVPPAVVRTLLSSWDRLRVVVKSLGPMTPLFSGGQAAPHLPPHHSLHSVHGLRSASATGRPFRPKSGRRPGSIEWAEATEEALSSMARELRHPSEYQRRTSATASRLPPLL